jgi:hypothetical protein
MNVNLPKLPRKMKKRLKRLIGTLHNGYSLAVAILDNERIQRSTARITAVCIYLISLRESAHLYYTGISHLLKNNSTYLIQHV